MPTATLRHALVGRLEKCPLAHTPSTPSAQPVRFWPRPGGVRRAETRIDWPILLDLDVPADGFSLRYAGQLRIDTAGTYTLSVDIGADTSDGYRLWIDGVLVANHWSSLPDKLTAALTLTEGWHDLLLDHSENTGSAQAVLRMVGPGVPDGPSVPRAPQLPTAVWINKPAADQPDQLRDQPDQSDQIAISSLN